MVTKAEVRASETARLLRVVREVCLAILVGVVTDNLDGVLVGTDSTVCTQTIELGLEDAFAAECHFLLQRERLEGHVVNDAQSEVVFWFWQSKVVKHGDDHGRRSVARAETITATNDDRTVFSIVECVFHVEVKRFAIGTWFLRTVEHCNLLASLRHSGQEVLNAERTIEVNADHTDLLALGVHIVDSFTGSFSHRTHADDHALCIFCAIIAKEFVFTARNLRNGSHVFFNDSRDGIVVRIAYFTVCEEGFRVLSHTTSNRMLWRQGAVAELAHLVHRNERTDIFHVHLFNLLVFM